jgi:hypothetical protein
MMELINTLSWLDDLLLIGGVLLVAYGQTLVGIACVLLGLGIMASKGEILSPVP